MLLVVREPSMDSEPFLLLTFLRFREKGSSYRALCKSAFYKLYIVYQLHHRRRGKMSFTVKRRVFRKSGLWKARWKSPPKVKEWTALMHKIEIQSGWMGPNAHGAASTVPSPQDAGRTGALLKYHLRPCLDTAICLTTVDRWWRETKVQSCT